MKKLLVISPFINDRNLYPHLKSFLNEISKYFYLEYYYYYERGYWLDEYFSISRRTQLYTSFKYILLDSYKLLKYRKKYDLIITIDNFIYSVVSYLFPNEKIILWNHDFVSYDNNKSKHFVQKLISKTTKKYLSNSKKLIIQNNKRLSIFLKSLNMESNQTLNAFFLPVSLSPTKINIKKVNLSNPILMQIGGINSFRSGSDFLLCHYQENYKFYTLFFHGFISEEIQKMIYNAKKVPFTSSIILPPENIYQIVEYCDIGFIYYQADDLNFYHISTASCQLVEFFRCGKPVISLGKNDLVSFLYENNLGVGIRNMLELNNAIKQIKENYFLYSQNCLNYFDNIMNIKNYIPPLLEWLQKND